MRLLFETIKRFFYWGWALRNNRDWDNTFLDEIILLKLQRMRACFNSEEFHHNRWSLKEELEDTRQIEFKQGLIDQYKADVALDICISILKRRMDDRYYDKLVGLEKLYERVEHNFDNGTINTIVDGKPATPEFRSYQRELMFKSAEIAARDNKLLFSLMEKFNSSWWS